MSERLNRREAILETAHNLFSEQGYSATSVRQIADGVGCTEAALYYHFKQGKRELLQVVMEEQLPDLMNMIEECQNATSLEEFFQIYGTSLLEVGRTKLPRLRWLVAEFTKLTPEERAPFHARHLELHAGLAKGLQKFIPDAVRAQEVAWVLMCTGFGYAQLFWSLELESQVNFTPHDLTRIMAQWLTAAN